MDKQPRLEVMSGEAAREQVLQFPLPADSGILHIPPNELTWPMIVPRGGLEIQIQPGMETELTYGIATTIVAFEETFHLLGRVDYAYGEQEATTVFRLDYHGDKDMLASISELGILVLTDERPPKYATKEDLAAFFTRVPTFVCELSAEDVHRLHIQLIRMQAQESMGR